MRYENNLGIQNERDDDSGLKLPELGNYHNVSCFRFQDLAPLRCHLMSCEGVLRVWACMNWTAAYAVTVL